MKCLDCGSPARLLVVLNPEVVMECPKCGHVFSVRLFERPMRRET